MTVTITTGLGQPVCGQIRVWLGRRVVEIESDDGRRHLGRLHPDPRPVDGRPDQLAPTTAASTTGGVTR